MIRSGGGSQMDCSGDSMAQDDVLGPTLVGVGDGVVVARVFLLALQAPRIGRASRPTSDVCFLVDRGGCPR